jgi:hypothetical protein
MLDRKTLIIIARCPFSSTVAIIGSMFTIAERFDRRFDLETKISRTQGRERTTGDLSVIKPFNVPSTIKNGRHAYFGNNIC